MYGQLKSSEIKRKIAVNFHISTNKHFFEFITMKNESSLFDTCADEDDQVNPSTREKDSVICAATSKLNSKYRVELRKSDFLQIEGH